jgi:GT2 family glycosyltransferase/glycosyltransferase involved in cell wall biosynthesis
MQIVGLMLVRNEADILRVNLQYHLSSGIDRFLVVDNGSSDGTDRVLEELARNGRVRWTRDSGPYRQAEITTELAREAFLGGADWVIPIDADEFWRARDGDLRRVLEQTPAGALRVQVINFVQRRDQLRATPDALIHMTRRTPLPIGRLEQVRELVETDQFSYVEVTYQPKWISRACREIEIAMGDHAVKGIPGVQTDSDAILCLHAPLRSQSALEAKAKEGGRFLQLGLGPEQWWQARRWNRLANNGTLETEWRANSYVDDHLDVFGQPHGLVFDPALRDLVLPFIEETGPPRTGAVRTAGKAKARTPRRNRSRSAVSRREYDALQRTVQDQLIAHHEQIDEVVHTFDAQLRKRDQAIYDLQAAADTQIKERDDLIRRIQSELHTKVGDRDETILKQQFELREKVGERDRLVRDLQNELQTKVSDRDSTILRLQDKLRAGAPEPGVRALETVAQDLQAALYALQEQIGAEARLASRMQALEQRERRLDGASEREASLVKRLQAAYQELQKQGNLEVRLVRTQEMLEQRERVFAALETEFRAASESHANLARRLESMERVLESARHELQKQAELETRLGQAQLTLKQREQALETLKGKAEELARLHGSRLWRIGCAYWGLRASALKVLGSILGTFGADSAIRRPHETAIAAGSAEQPSALELPNMKEPSAAETYPAPQRTLPATEPVAEPRPEAQPELETERQPKPEPAGVPIPALPPPIPAESSPADWGVKPAPWLGRHFEVVCFPIIDWGFRFQRPQQLMCQFAAAGHRVFYITPWFRTSGPPYEVRQLREGVFEVSLRGPDVNIYTQTLRKDSLGQVFEGLNQLRRDWSFGAAISFVQLPFWYPITAAARDRLAWPIVYDCMDHHAGFTTNSPAMLEEEEDRLLRNADLVVASSAYLESKARKENDNVLLVRNACDFEHFAGTAPDRVGPPTIGYYGAIADWFDSDLVADLAERRPDWRFVLVGSTFTADIERLSKLANVQLVGEVPYGEVPKWLTRFDVTVLPFKRIPLTEATNPVKAYEILAAGKSLVSVPLPEIVPLTPLVRIASTPEEFEKEILEELAAKGWGRERDRRAYAAENTWAARFEKLSPALRQVFPKVSIVVVSYNNLEMSRQCLESIYDRTTWPNFEVIVVDNASIDGTPEFLKASEKTYSRLSVILNDSNVGFAAANNRALEKASGDYVVLLNNDTIVSRGWVETLVRHLQADPEIGIIGPVTNAIGNEAMVPVGYSEVEQMPTWAQGYVREHANEAFEIPMLAMFCIAMRREVFEKVGPLDDRFGIGMFEDDDYAIRIRRAGYRVVCAGDSFVHHWMKAAFGKIPAEEYQTLFEKNRRLFEEKWGTSWIPHSAMKEEQQVLVPTGGLEGPRQDAV